MDTPSSLSESPCSRICLDIEAMMTAREAAASMTSLLPILPGLRVQNVYGDIAFTQVRLTMRLPVLESPEHRL